VTAALLESPWGPRLQLLEQDAGLHFLLRVETELSDEALEARCMDAGIRVLSLGRYYHGPVPESDRHCLVINYSGLRSEQIALLENMLREL
jgi:GntR family transcriptional regulator/MocR family aminotransferase